MHASFDVEGIESWVAASASDATKRRRVVVAFSFSHDDTTALTLITVEPRFFGEVHEIYAQEYNTRLSLGRYLKVDQAVRFASLHRNLEITSYYRADFNSADKLQRQVVRDILYDLFPSQWSARGFLLFDIVEFSIRTPAEQVALRLSLMQAIETAHATFRAVCTTADSSFNVIPTGDGFYLWHGRPGRIHDAATLVLGAFAIASVRRPTLSDLELELRSALAVERVFTVPTGHLGDGSRGRFHDAIGPAPNIAARLCAAASPGQLLVSDIGQVVADPTETIITTADLVDVANRVVDRADMFHLELDPAAVLKFSDKHGEAHRCFNVKGVSLITGTTDRSVRIGLQQDDAQQLDTSEFVRY